MTLVRTVDPEPLVSLVDAKLHLRVDHDADDDLIQSLLDAAVAHLDGPYGVLGRCLGRQTWEFRRPAFAGSIRLPLRNIVAVKAFGPGDADTRAPLPIRVERRGECVDVAVDAGGFDAVAIEMEVEGPPEILPVIVAVIKLLVGHWYQNREAVVTGTIATTLPVAVPRLLTPLKVRWI